MKMSNFKKISSLLLCLVLIAAMALSFTGCTDEITDETEANSVETPQIEDGVIGQGSKSFEFTVIDKDGNEFKTTVRTDKTIVGEALLEVDLIAGEDSEYGLYVKTVNGQTLDYEKDGKYWAFYIDGEYALTGVDATEIIEGQSYMFKAE